MKQNLNDLFLGKEEEVYEIPKVLIISIDKIKAESYIDDNVAEDDIRIAAEFIQDTIVANVIGKCLYDKLKVLICEEQLAGRLNAEYRQLLEEYLHPIFIWGIPAELNIPLSFKQRNIGTYQVNGGDEIKSTELEDIKYLNQYYRNKMDFYVNRAIDFLKCNKCFPEISCGCECGWSKALTKQPTTPLNLTPPKCNKKRYRRW